MGYRSDIAAVFYASKVEDMPVIKLWLQENFPIDTFEASVRWFDKGMVFSEENVKWYDTYPEVIAFEDARGKFVDLFCEGKENVVEGAFEFIRVGEQYDDVETAYRGNYDGLLDLERKITVPV
jgi:hypothetical protein